MLFFLLSVIHSHYHSLYPILNYFVILKHCVSKQSTQLYSVGQDGCWHGKNVPVSPKINYAHICVRVCVCVCVCVHDFKIRDGK